MIAWWWLLVAFVVGVVVEYQIGTRIVRWGIWEPKIFEATLRKMDFDGLLRLRSALDAETMKRTIPRRHG